MSWAVVGSIITVAATVTTAVATVYIAEFTGSLRDVTERLRGAGDRQLHIATQAANASTDSAKAVVENERPWVGLYTVAPNPKLSAGTQIGGAVVAVIKNSGRTPARKICAAFKGYILNAEDPRPTADNSRAPAKALFPNTIDQYRPFEGDQPLSEVEWAALKNGTRVAWVVGRIDYLSIGDHKAWTDVCTRWRPLSGEFEPHDEGNDAE